MAHHVINTIKLGNIRSVPFLTNALIKIAKEMYAAGDDHCTKKIQDYTYTLFVSQKTSTHKGERGVEFIGEVQDKSQLVLKVIFLITFDELEGNKPKSSSRPPPILKKKTLRVKKYATIRDVRMGGLVELPDVFSGDEEDMGKEVIVAFTEKYGQPESYLATIRNVERIPGMYGGHYRVTVQRKP